MKNIAVINQKGGVGKSTTALALGAGLLLRGYRVLFVDLDAQGNLSFVVGAEARNSLEALLHPERVHDYIQETEQGHIIASSPALVGADAVITQTGKEYKLRELLQEGVGEGQYDYCIIDTPPALGILTVNALSACHGAIIPAQADMFSLQGISQLHGTIQTVKKYCNPSLTIMGILLSRYNSRSIISREVASMIEETASQLETKLYAAKIRECTAIKEAQATRQSIFSYAPRSNAAADYSAFIDEVIGDA